MGKVACPKCHRVFDSGLEYRLHWSHSHYGPVPAPLTQQALEETEVEEVEKVEAVEEVEEPKADEEAPYSLATSGEGLGELYPVLMDAHGNVIDGFHRLGENPKWHTEVRPQIDTPVKLQLAMLAANFNRRKVSPEEIAQRVTFLVKAGLKPEEIAKVTGISKKTIYKYMPQELKSETSGKISEALKSKYETAREEEVHRVTSSSEISDSKKEGIPTSSTSVTSSTEPKPKKIMVPETIPEGTPICPCCGTSLDPAEYQEIKTAMAVKYGKQIQTLLFPPSLPRTS